jgi:hypothetical protein
MSGLINELTLLNGKIIRWKDMVYFCGQMAENMKEIIKMIIRMDLEFSVGILSF